MVRLRLIVGFAVIVAISIVQNLLIMTIGLQARGQYAEIAQEIAPILIAAGETTTIVNRLQAEALSIALLVDASDGPNSVDIDAIASEVRAEIAAGVPFEEDDEDAEDSEGSNLDEALEEAREFVVTFIAVEQPLAQLETLLGAEDPDVLALRELTQEVYDRGIALIRTAQTDSEDVGEAKEALEEAEDAILDLLNKITTAEQTRLATQLEVVNSWSTNGVFVVVASFLGSIVASVLGVILITRSITRPLGRVQAAAQRIASGQYDVRLKTVERGELGELQTAINAMAGAVQERDELLHDVNKQLNTRMVEVDQALEEAERANQAKSMFLASMSHELRTPLNAIINFSKFVAQGDLGPVNDEQSKLLFDVVANGKHLLALINDVLDMSKIEAGSFDLFLQDDVDLAEILQDALENAKALVEDKPIEIRSDIPEDLPLLRADKRRLRQIANNLVSNACKYTQTGFIELQARANDDDTIQFSVQDSGIGIAADEQEAIFSAFLQTEEGLRLGGGTGLGLAISRNLAELHGGTLWLTSALGVGSTFYVKIPTVAPTRTQIARTS